MYDILIALFGMFVMAVLTVLIFLCTSPPPMTN
jgi:hypothetical protein